MRSAPDAVEVESGDVLEDPVSRHQLLAHGLRALFVVPPVTLSRDTRDEGSDAMLDPRHQFLIDFCVP
jgi:hypothetical protein